MSEKLNILLYNINLTERIFKNSWDCNSINDIDFQKILDGRWFLEWDSIDFDDKEIEMRFFYNDWEEKEIYQMWFLKTISPNIKTLTNKRISFLLFLFYKSQDGKNNKLYAISWWNWWSFINSYINHNFWFDIVSRLLTDDDKIKSNIKYLHSKELLWNVDSQSRNFKWLHSMIYENSYWTIYKDVIVSIWEDLLKNIWIDNLTWQNKKNNVWVSVSSWFSLKKRLDKDELINVIKKISEIYLKNPTFAFNWLNYIKNKEDKELIKVEFLKFIEHELLLNKNFDNFSIFDNNSEMFQDSIFLKYWNKDVELDFLWDNLSFVILGNVVQLYDENKDDIKEIENFLMNIKIFWKEKGLYWDIFSLLNVEFVCNGSTYFYFFWNFYKVENKLEINVKDDFSRIYKDFFIDHKVSYLNKVWWNMSEWKYNALYEWEKWYFVFDAVIPVSWVEFCDVLYYDWKEVHIFHNKEKFWQSTRDLVFQIKNSTNLLKNFIDTQDSDVYFIDLYNKMKSKSESFSNAFSSFDDFRKIFLDWGKIHIYAWIKYTANWWDFTKCKSLIPKICINDLQKDLNRDFLLTNFKVIKL